MAINKYITVTSGQPAEQTRLYCEFVRAYYSELQEMPEISELELTLAYAQLESLFSQRLGMTLAEFWTLEDTVDSDALDYAAVQTLALCLDKDFSADCRCVQDDDWCKLAAALA